jgi:uncharacterized protein
MEISARIAAELGAKSPQISAAIELLDSGATVPFIARYRKEATGGLDDARLRLLAERLRYLRELEERRQTVLNTIREQGKLTSDLERVILEADTKMRLEDLYAPYRPKRRTKATIAREAGLGPLAEALRLHPELEPRLEAVRYVDPDPQAEDARGVPDREAALEGARQILMERFAEDPSLVGQLRERLWAQGVLRSAVVAGKEGTGAKFRDYFDYGERIKAIPSHRALALFRGRNEGVLRLSLRVEDDKHFCEAQCEAAVANHFGIRKEGRAADDWLFETAHAAWKFKLLPHIEVDLKLRLREAAEQEAIRVFTGNLKDLLLAAPAGARTTMGLDPGLRTGVKVAVVDTTGKVLETATVYPHPPQHQWAQSIEALAHLVVKHGVELISIGNGTASRETERLVAELMRRHPERKLVKVMVSEAGASVYSASEIAREELPQLDVSLRGAVSIARRVQDPLAELVKIEPKSIGVGQYQHDVNQGQLTRSLEEVVEDCVNAVGVDVNTASVALLKHVAGFNQGLARNLVAYRDQHGAFVSREQFKEVPRLGTRAFEQAAGFLRVMKGDNPLDASAVHPEAYAVVKRIQQKTGHELKDLIGHGALLRTLNPQDYTDDRFGIPTVTDILAELEKPGRDPRPEFKSAIFQEGVEKLEDLRPGMHLEGVVTNVTNFGAFVDVGVHQDGLVHVSMLAERFVKDPRQVVKTGDVVKVWVLEVDLERRRISLSMRKNVPSPAGKPIGGADPTPKDRTPKQQRKPKAHSRPQTAMAEALARARKR